MGQMSRISERLAVVGTIDPDAYGTGAQNTDVIDMRYWRRVLFVVMAGELGSSATLDFAVNGDTASDGLFATAITGKAITQLTQAGTDADKQVLLEVTAEEVAAQGLRYIRGTATLGTATSDYGVAVLAEPAHGSLDVRTQDLATVDEIVG